MNLSARYRDTLAEHGYSETPGQINAVRALQTLGLRLEHTRGLNPQDGGLFSSWRRRSKRVAVPGIYLWGGVGRGKTWLVDLFYAESDEPGKHRIHFHRFMRKIHGELAQLKHQADPLERVAEKLAGDSRLICLDEFHVTDIADAMILARLLKALFERGVTLVTTSNAPPDDLYRNGLQRALFLPAIELLKQHTDVIELDDGIDYRLRFLDRAEVYHTPLDDAADIVLLDGFEHLVAEPGPVGEEIEIEGRLIAARRQGDGVIWFDFSALCNGPRSQMDYIEIARCFHTVLISDVPRMADGQNDVTKRFILLIDEFYDRNVKLILSAQELPEKLYQGERLAFEFQRTASRLREMQSHDWLARPHRP